MGAGYEGGYPLLAGGGGADTFDEIGSGTNASAAMVVGNGASLAATGTGTIDATTLLTKTWASPAAIGTGTPAAGTFTALTSPTITGGSGTTQTLTYKTTTGVGASGADHVFVVGNNGASEAMRIYNNRDVLLNAGALYLGSTSEVLYPSIIMRQSWTSGGTSSILTNADGANGAAIVIGSQAAAPSGESPLIRFAWTTTTQEVCKLTRSGAVFTQLTGNYNRTASTEYSEYLFDGSASTKTWATGALTTQRYFLVKPPTYAFAGASTLSTAATFAVTAAPTAGTNATITNPLAGWFQAGNVSIEAGALFVGEKGLDADLTTATVAPRLATVSNSTSSTAQAHLVNGNGTSGSISYFLKTRGTGTDANTTVVSGDTLGSLRWLGADGATYIGAARCTVSCEGTIGTGAVPGRVVWQTANAAGTLTDALIMDSAQNVCLSGASAGTDAVGVLSVANGTVPTTGPANCVQFYSTDDSAGNTVPSFYCEGSGVVSTGQADSASSVRVKMRINGTVRTFLCI